MEHQERNQTHWFDKLLFENNFLTVGAFIFGVIIVLAVISRFYGLGARTISHDETSHVYYAWRLFKGMGYAHTPLTHGPLQFHLVALSYFFFGDNDFTARIPAAVFSILSIAFLWRYKHFLGKTGVLVTSFLMLISPFMLYYGRYVRNEVFVGLFGLITIWAVLNYLETGAAKYTYWLTAATTLHFATKETAFIYTAQVMIFLGILFVLDVLASHWKNLKYKKPFIISLILALLLFMALVGIKMYASTLSVSPADTGLSTSETGVSNSVPTVLIIMPLILSGVSLLIALYFAIRGLSWQHIKANRSFSLLILLGTLVLPQLAPFPVKFLGWDPTDYSYSGMIHTGIFLIPLAILAIIIGLLWNRKLWLINAGIFYIPFTLLYTTFFTNGVGFFTGIVGSLGYWLEQQAVKRGNQPWYYYIGLQVPVYEYLTALGTIVTVGVYAWFRKNFHKREKRTSVSGLTENLGKDLFLPFMIFWVITSVIAYSIAGEKMPWLTYHIALPMILVTGWGLGKLIDYSDWGYFREKRGVLTISLLIVFLISLSKVFAIGFSPNPPFQGQELAQLSITSTFLVALAIVIVSGWWLAILVNEWDLSKLGFPLALMMFVLLALLTIRTSIMASYINYDNAKEYLVYAHMARGPKEAYEQILELSQRTTDGLAMEVAYDDETTYPYWWYLRNFTNQKYYGENPTRELRDAPVILVGAKNYDKIQPVVGQAYYAFDYIRIWWPNQDYFNLTSDRIKHALTDPEMRAAIFQIWLNRDYTKYAELTNQDMSLENWTPSGRMRLYVRKDIASKVWNLGMTQITEEEVKADPYEGKGVNLTPDVIIGSEGSEPGEFNMPRNIAVAPDGSLYIADSGNHRIQHITKDGEVLNVWGSFGDVSTGDAPPGTFYEPWGIAIDSDGFVYVADTWNHRIQKFDSYGNFVKQWGYFGQAEEPTAFWGPRDVAIDSNDRIFISDTGNKRIVVFDTDGNYLASFGSAGLLLGQFDEPVGLAIDATNRVYVADTWNQRIQRFVPSGDGLDYIADKEWEISGWYGQSLDNKPYLVVDSNGHLFASDPDGYRILEFNSDGEFVKFWGDYGTDENGLNLPTGLAVDATNGLWVVDTGNNRILHFVP